MFLAGLYLFGLLIIKMVLVSVFSSFSWRMGERIEGRETFLCRYSRSDNLSCKEVFGHRSKVPRAILVRKIALQFVEPFLGDLRIHCGEFIWEICRYGRPLFLLEVNGISQCKSVKVILIGGRRVGSVGCFSWLNTRQGSGRRRQETRLEKEFLAFFLALRRWT